MTGRRVRDSTNRRLLYFSDNSNVAFTGHQDGNETAFSQEVYGCANYFSNSDLGNGSRGVTKESFLPTSSFQYFSWAFLWYTFGKHRDQNYLAG